MVVVHRGESGNRRLAAYYVAEQAVPGEELRAHLARQLPEYMVPGSFTRLAELPLNANGKVDRRALPRPEIAEADRDLLKPGNATERTLAAVWCEVLELEAVGIQDNFFDLGGHSLLAIQVQKRLRESFARPISIVELFRHATIRAQARFFDAREEVSGAAAGGERARARLASQERRKRARCRRRAGRTDR